MPASQKLSMPKGRENYPARKVARYINQHWGGNLSAAARDLGCSYDALRETALGHAVRPNVAVFQALVAHAATVSAGDASLLTLEGWLQ